MTTPQTPSAECKGCRYGCKDCIANANAQTQSEAMHFLNSIIPQQYTGCMGLVEIEKLVPIREYIRILEKEHRAMRDAIEYEESHALGCADGDDGEGCSCFKKVLSSLTIHD